jgi:DNA primase
MDAVDEIKHRLSIEDVIGEYVELRRAGRNFKALSPFGNEKTPSFMVSPEKQIWHDFSSGKGGNMFSFVMEMEGLDFKAALELLARKAGLDLSQYRRGDGANAKLKERIGQAHELATKFYQTHLSRNQTAIDYVFKKRGINKEAALAFKLGYAPNNGAALTTFLLGRGFNAEELKKAGLSTQRGARPSDMFRGRIMVPLMDQTGRVIGFTGRLLEDVPGAPKYLNTPQTLLYDKGRHVFGLHLAKEAIRKQDFVVVVEGNLDVIASHQVNVTNVVATAGTAITEMHLKALGRFTHDVRLCFDQDGAGLAAAERAIPLASKAEVSLSMITITGAKDPDELIQKDRSAWEAAIQKPQYALDWLIERYQQQLDLGSAPGKREFSDIMLAVIRRLGDQVEQEHYLNKIGQLLGVSKEALQSKLRTGTKTTVRKRSAPAPIDKHQAEVIKSQNHLLALALMVPNMREYLQPLTPEMLPEQPAQELLAFLQAQPDFSGKPQEVAALKNIADYSKMLLVIFEELYQDLEVLELRYEAARLQVRLIEQFVKTKKAALTAALQDANDQQTTTLLTQVKALDALLKPIKQGGTHAQTSSP